MVNEDKFNCRQALCCFTLHQNPTHMKIKHVAATVALTVLTLITCKFWNRSENKPTVSIIQPPIPTADVPFSAYAVDADKGEILHFSSGSSIIFPSGAFVDESGKPVHGKVDVVYREFSSPIDFFLSGIPMQYDSAGTTYNFESAGMCDVRAFKDKKPVFVNPAVKPVVNLVSHDAAEDYSLYYLDTANKKWVNLGKSKVLQVQTPAITEDFSTIEPIVMPIKPVMPEKINGDMPVIRLNVDTSSFAELRAFDKLQFQLDKNENRFDPKDATEEWADFKLNKRNGNGLYEIGFSNKTRSVNYLAKPVLDEKDYKKGLEIFNAEMRKYEKKLISLKEERESKIITLQRIDSLNNIAIDKENEQMEKRNKVVMAENYRITKENIKDMNSLMRSFEITGFGVWNCDRPRPVYFKGQFQVVAHFLDENKINLALSKKNVFYKSVNGLTPFEGEKIALAQFDENMIIGTSSDTFYYASYENVKAMKLSPNVKECRIVMKRVENKNNNYSYITKLFGN